jgi:hypothetical protein
MTEFFSKTTFRQVSTFSFQGTSHVLTRLQDRWRRSLQLDDEGKVQPHDHVGLSRDIDSSLDWLMGSRVVIPAKAGIHATCDVDSLTQPFESRLCPNDKETSQD